MSYQVAGWFDVVGGEGLLLLSRGEWEPLAARLRELRAGRRRVASRGTRRGAGPRRECRVAGQGLPVLRRVGRGQVDPLGVQPARSRDQRRPVAGAAAATTEVWKSWAARSAVPTKAATRSGAASRSPPDSGLIQDTRAEVRPIDRSRAFAELVGNLPFVAEAFSKRGDLFRRTLESFSTLPLAHLHFAKDDSYWDAIAAAGY